ncbi:MAG: hypothetical protein QOC57_369 [Ilumatobacteraceae bacterium]
MRTVVVIAVAAGCSLTACSGAAPATAGDYCATVSSNLDKLNAPAIVDAAGIQATSDLYRSITSVAPLAVQKEWQTMTSNVEAAAAIDPSDAASVQRIADMARTSQHAASTISDYTAKICGVTIVTPTTTIPVVVSTTAP